MNNKDKLIKAIDKDLNKNDTLNIIHKRIEKSYKFNNTLKYAFVPSLILILVLFTFFNNENKKLNTNNTYGSDTNINTSQDIYINEVVIQKNDDFDSLENNSFSDENILDTKDVKYKVIEKLEGYDFYKNLNLDDKYNVFTMYELYIKENDKDTEYTKLNNYIISYKVKKEDKLKEIEISFSKENKPLSKYNFDNANIQTSKINNVDIEIYISDNTYISIFNYDNINFNITTYNLSQKELIDLLKSIIK